MRRLALLALLSLAVSADASLSVGVNPQPGSISSGQNITVFLQVSNFGGGTAYDVSTTVEVGNGSATLLAPASPVSQTIAFNGSASYTWIFQGQGCNPLSFSAYATGFDSTTVTASNSSSIIPVACTPSPTPTITPTSTATPVVSATATPTQTPWIIFGTATPAPSAGDASIPGNLYHPDQGQLQLKFNVPAEGTVTIEIYNRLGNRVRRIERNVMPGSYTELWDGRNDQGLLVAAGIYAAQFRGKGLFKAVKFAVVK